VAVAVDDSGKKLRFEILRREVARKILERQGTHNCAANMEREVGEGEHFIVAAERVRQLTW